MNEAKSQFLNNSNEGKNLPYLNKKVNQLSIQD